MLPKSIDTLRIDINSGKVRKSVAICQQDSVQRTLNFQLVDSGTALDMSNLLFAEILIHKADGYEADNGCVIDGDSVQYTLRSTDTSALGTNVAQLQLTFADGQVITTPTFEIEVYSKVLDQRVQTSTNEYTALTQQLVQVNELKNQTEGFKDSAEISAQTASEKAEEVVSSVEAAAQSALAAQSLANAAAQSVEQAETAASNAAESATNASTSATSAAASATTAREIADGIADDCQGYVTEAQTYAENALESFHAAEDEATNAQSSAEAAATSASNASASASAASTSATNAAASEDNALDYAERAEEAYRKMGEEGLVLGETDSTAYRGDRGKTAYDHSQTTGNPHATTYSDVGADQAGAAAAAYQQAAGYTDLQIANLINGAPQTLDTLKEIADAMAESQDVVEALQAAIGDKADQADFTGHANNSTIHITATERTTWNAKQNLTDDSKDNTVTFTSTDNTSVFNSGNLGGQSAYAWSTIAKISTGEKHSSLLNKVSTMFKNVRTIAKLIGTTDISSIGNGTLSGGISALNNDLSDIDSKIENIDGYYPVTADGVKTVATLLNEIASAASYSKMNSRTVLKYGNTFYRLAILNASTYTAVFDCASNDSNGVISLTHLTVKPNASTMEVADGTQVRNVSGSVPSNGYVLELHYNKIVN